MYMCIYICMYLCVMYLSMYVFMYVCVYSCMCVCMYVRMCICMYYLLMYVYVLMYLVHIYLFMICVISMPVHQAVQCRTVCKSNESLRKNIQGSGRVRLPNTTLEFSRKVEEYCEAPQTEQPVFVSSLEDGTSRKQLLNKWTVMSRPLASDRYKLLYWNICP